MGQSNTKSDKPNLPDLPDVSDIPDIPDVGASSGFTLLHQPSDFPKVFGSVPVDTDSSCNLMNKLQDKFEIGSDVIIMGYRSKPYSEAQSLVSQYVPTSKSTFLQEDTPEAWDGVVETLLSKGLITDKKTMRSPMIWVSSTMHQGSSNEPDLKSDDEVNSDNEDSKVTFIIRGFDTCPYALKAAGLMESITDANVELSSRPLWVEWMDPSYVSSKFNIKIPGLSVSEKDLRRLCQKEGHTTSPACFSNSEIEGVRLIGGYNDLVKFIDPQYLTSEYPVFLYPKKRLF
jgi:hypothetical protein